MLPTDKQKNPISAILVVDNLDKATDFYYRAFGALEQERYADSTGKVWYAVVDVLGTPIQLMEPFAEMGHAAATAENVAKHGDQLTLNVHVENAGDTFQRGVKARATALSRPARASWGTDTASFRDPFGHRWTMGSALNTREAAMAPVAISVVAADVARTVAFFTRVFGASKPVKHRDATLSAADYQVILINGAPLQIVKASKSSGLQTATTAGRPGGDVSLLTVAYADVDGASQRALAAGGVSVVDPQDAYWGDRYTEFRTEDGLRAAACGEQELQPEVVTPTEAQLSFRKFLDENENPSSPADVVGVRNV